MLWIKHFPRRFVAVTGEQATYEKDTALSRAQSPRRNTVISRRDQTCPLQHIPHPRNSLQQQFSSPFFY